jgi:membrane fusion protein (multidrug efflux system)
MTRPASKNNVHGIAARLRFAACACVVVTLFACSKQPAETGAQKGAAAGTPPAMPVTMQRVQVQRVPISLDAVGQAEGSREVEIRARISGIIEKRVYTEGAPVAAGAVLFVIDKAPYEIAVSQARAALSQERARQEQAQRESERLKGLAQNKAISQREYDEAVSTLKQSSAAIEGAQARLDEAQLNLSYTTVKAPISGIAGRALRSEGSLVTANTDSSLLTLLTQINPIWVRFSLAESDFDRIRGVESRAQVRLLAQDGSVVATGGRLNFSGTTVDPKLGTVQLRAEFGNPNGKWLPGQYLKVQVLAGEQQAFLVPQAAVVQTEQDRFVWVVGPDNKANMRPVKTANWIGANWVVTGGLQSGETIVVDNLMKLRPGAAVQPAPAGAAGGQAPAGGAPAASAGDKKAPPAPPPAPAPASSSSR